MIVNLFFIFLFIGFLKKFKLNLIYVLTFISVYLVIYTLVGQPETFYLDSLFYYDGIRFILVSLRVWVRILIIFSRYKIFRFKEHTFYFYSFVFLLLFILLLTFFSGNLIFFYFFFEVSLIPTLLIIMGWGYQPERVQAGIYFLFYTLTASLPLLLLIMYLYIIGGSVSLFYRELLFYSFSGFNFFVITAFMGSIAFLVKLPMYFTHLWLPKAHVEAPVAGSIILAGVLLKLGGYGLIRVLSITGVSVIKFSPYFIGLRLARIMFTGILCCRLNDFKALVAYSSVAHIAMVIGGLITLYSWGFMGALVMIVAHGVSSSGLFCMVNLYYERTGSRSFFINKGLILSFPIFSLLIFFLCASNIAAPPTINLLSEIFLIARIMSYDYIILLFFPLGSFLGAVFTLFIFSFSQHGPSYNSLYGFVHSNVREIHTIRLHIVPVNFLVLGSNFIFTLY